MSQNRAMQRWGACASVLLLAAMAAGCQTGGRVNVQQSFVEGEYGVVRTELTRRLPQNVEPTPSGERRVEQSDRDYILARMRLAMAMLADGYRDNADTLVDEIYEMMRMQGLNPDRTTMSIFSSEDRLIWKGEPFEQALSYHYVGLHYAMQGSWDNTRAALSNAMFHLREFGRDDEGQPLDATQVIDHAVEEDLDEEYFDEGYEVVESDFTLGYLMSGIANQQIGRDAEAEEQFSKALAIDPHLQPLVEVLRQELYNTLLVVDYGQAPQKVATGPDNVIAAFRPRMQSDLRPLQVEHGDQTYQLPAVTDVNRMALDHRWRSIEDMRRSRAEAGRALQATGQMVTAAGMAFDDTATQIAGLAIMFAGSAARSAAAADTRHLETLPQRIYLAPLELDDPEQPIRVQVQSDRRSSFVLAAPADDQSDAAVRVHYLRLLTSPDGDQEPPQWAQLAQRHYTDEHGQTDLEPNLPYILGGRCVRPPSEEVLASYQEAGFLQDLTLDDLRELYELENIEIELERGTYPGRHVLEAGLPGRAPRTLATPEVGTMGYARLFYREHRPYRPQSEEVRALAQRIREKLAPDPEQQQPETAPRVAGQ